MNLRKQEKKCNNKDSFTVEDKNNLASKYSTVYNQIIGDKLPAVSIEGAGTPAQNNTCEKQSKLIIFTLTTYLEIITFQLKYLISTAKLERRLCIH